MQFSPHARPPGNRYRAICSGYTHTDADKIGYAFLLRYAPVLHARLDKLRTRGTSPCSTIHNSGSYSRETSSCVKISRILVHGQHSLIVDNVPCEISSSDLYSVATLDFNATSVHTPSPDTPLLPLLRYRLFSLPPSPNPTL